VPDDIGDANLSDIDLGQRRRRLRVYTLVRLR
jgi:hypothetical protein